MFRAKKKKTEDTPVEDISQSGAAALKTDDGGYLGPGAVPEGTDDRTLNNNRKNYQSTQNPAPSGRGGTAAERKRRESTLGGGASALWITPPLDSDAGSVSSVAESTVERNKCCNPDYPMCGGCCYPYSFFGFSQNQSLVLMAIGLFMILTGLIIGIVLLLTTMMGRHTLCSTPECVVAAGEIISSMDQTVNPCDDFVSFACGGWKLQHPVPAGMMGWDAFSHTADTTNYKIKDMLEAPAGSEDPKAVNITKTFYRACANTTAWEAVGVAPLMDEINKIGGFPLINSSWSDANYNWLNSVVMMRGLYAADYLLGIGVSYDSKNSSQYVIHIGEGYLPSPREFLLSNELHFRNMELKRITTIANILSSVTSSSSTASLTRSESKITLQQSGTDGSPPARPTSQHLDDETLKQILKASSHKKKMQMQRTEAVIPMSSTGTAPEQSPDNVLDTLSNMHEEDAEVVSDTLGSRLFSRQGQSDIIQLYDFIRKLANITMSSVEANDQYAQYNPMTVQQLQQRTDALGSQAVKLNWLSYINGVFGEVNITVKAGDRIIVATPRYLDNLLKLLKVTPNNIIANFLAYMLTLNLGEEASTAFSAFAPVGRHQDRQYMPRYIGRKEVRPWYDCSLKSNLLLGGAVSYLYLRSSFSYDTLMETREMVSDVHAAFQVILSDAAWMDDETRTAGLTKLMEMKQLVGHAVDALNTTALDEHYKELPELSPTQHFFNVLKLAHHLSKQSMLMLREQPSRDEFTMNPIAINAAYSFNQNAMLIPAGILQPPFYRKNTIRALNYGAIGIVIGHEISHGFDDSGKEMDAQGNLRQWWTNASMKTYNDKAQCFVDQYGQYPLKEDLKGDEQQLLGYKVNGVITQGENIADNGGIQASWRAYERRMQITREDPRLPGLEHYTDEQLFFISFAQLWCTNYTPQGLRSAILLGPHTPGPYRVKGCFHNTQQMQDAFGCSRDSSANFNQTCRLW